MSIRICLIGCGIIVNQYYLPSLKKMKEEGKVELAACCDLNLEKAQMAAETGFEKVYTDAEEMLCAEKPDGVLVCVLPEHMTNLVKKLAPFGIPMMLEKPPAMMVEEAKELAECLKEYHILHQVAFNRHFIPIVRSLKEKLQGEKVRNIQVQMCRVGRIVPNFYTTAIHSIDLLRFLAGQPYEEINYFYQDMPEYGPEQSNYYLNCRFADGTTGQITIMIESGLVNERIFVSCKDAAFYATLPVWECSDSPGEITVYRGDKIVEIEKGPEIGCDLQNAIASGFYGEIENFLKAVESGVQPLESIDFTIPLIDIAYRMQKHEVHYIK